MNTFVSEFIYLSSKPVSQSSNNAMLKICEHLKVRLKITISYYKLYRHHKLN